MRRKSTTWLLTLSLLVSIAGLLILASTGNAGGTELEDWVKTAAANQRTQNGDCPVAGEDCWELCLLMNGQLIPMGEFACM